MTKGLRALLCQLVCPFVFQLFTLTSANAQPVTGSGAEVAWLAPQAGAVVDVAAGSEKAVSLSSARRLPVHGWLAATMRPGEVAWVHLDGDADGKAVRFAFLSGGAEGSAAIEAIPDRRGNGDFLFTAPAATGLMNRLAISVRDGQEPPRAQIWVGGVNSPGFRWELWEEQVKKWAKHPTNRPPAPPDLFGESFVDRLATLQDALALAQAESGQTATAAVTALLQAAALLADLPVREPVFPYFRKQELTADLAHSRKLQKIEDQRMVEVNEAQPITFTLEGPSFLRIEARTQFDSINARRAAPMQVTLHADKRLVGLAAEEFLPIKPTDAKTDAKSEEAPNSSLRRITLATAPGRHSYELRVHGGPAWISVINHRRSMHAEQLANHSEDLPRLLEHARAGSRAPDTAGVLAALLDGEAAFLSLDDARARDRFQQVADKARNPRLQAFALLRLAALSPVQIGDRAASEKALAPALKLLEDGQDEATVRLRNLLIAEHLIRVVARTEPGEPAPKDAVALLLQHPDALAYMPAFAGPLLRYISGPRSLALPLLANAQARAPLDAALRHYLAREWFTGSRWAALPALETSEAPLVELLAPPGQLTTCEEAGQQGARAYAPLSEKDSLLDVAQNLAPAASLHRFNLVTLHTGAPRLSWAAITLDGQRQRLPMLLPRERLPFALAAGRHTLRASLPGEKPGALLGPCTLLQQPSDIALVMEHQFSALSGRGARVRVEVPGPGTPGFVGIELRPSATLRGGRLLLRTDQGIVGHIDVEGHGLDNQVIDMAIGPAILLELAVPATARTLDIVREDGGEMMLVRALLRRSLARPDRITPMMPVAERSDPAMLDRLRQATRVRRAAKEPAAQAHAQLKRAEILLSLGATALSRADAERALPTLSDADAQERTRELVATLNEPTLLQPRPSGVTAAILAAGADLEPTAEEESCVTRALAQFAKDRAQGRSAIEGCAGVFGRYAAARFAEQSGDVEAAAHHYEAAYLASLATGKVHPALARESALRYAERGPGAGSQDALALATAAAQADDLDAPRAIDRVRGLAHTRAVRGVDNGQAVRADEGGIAPLSLRAALADVPWEVGRYLEVRAGKHAETDVEAKQRTLLRIDMLCDDGGEPAALATTPPCDLRVEVDGAAADESRRQQLRAGEQSRLSEIPLEPGIHRIEVTLARRHAVAGPSDGAIAFVHLMTDHPLHTAAMRSDADGFFTVPITPPPVQRFIANAEQAVQFRVQGPTVLRMDVLTKGGADKRTIAAELTSEGMPSVQRVYAICTQPAERQLQNLQPGFDCRSEVLMPIVHAGTHRITLRPIGTPSVAMALSIFEDEPTAPGAGSQKGIAPLVADANGLLDTTNPALRDLRRPDSNLLRGLGTLQVQTLGVISTAGSGDPRLADKYSETGVYYRRKLDELPIWFKGGAILHLHEGGVASGGLDGLVFARIPVIQLRVYAELQGFSQSIDGTQAYALGFHSYLERSFQIAPHLFILPRFAFTANYQSLEGNPIATSTTGGVAQDGAAVSAAVTSIDPSIYNNFDAAHHTSIYGQVLLWWVPFINMIVYGRARVTSNQAAAQLDSVNGRFGFDMAIKTTEIVSYYDITQLMANDTRNNAILQHRLAGEVGQTLWLNRNHRLGLFLSANVEVVSRATTFLFGAFWEGSRGRGLDDYSTPEINLPQQLGQGRGYLRPEETLR